MCNITHAQDWRLVAQVRVTNRLEGQQKVRKTDSTHYYYALGSTRGSEDRRPYFYPTIDDGSIDSVWCDSARYFSRTVKSSKKGDVVTNSTRVLYQRKYDSANNLILTKYCKGDDSCLEEVYSYDASKKLVKQFSSNHQCTSVYEYDKEDRLAKLTLIYPSNVDRFLVTKEYDTVIRVTDYTYNSKGLLIRDSTYYNYTISPTVKRFFYDSLGRLTRDMIYYSSNKPYADAPGFYYTYSSTSQLIKRKFSNGVGEERYTYYPDGMLEKSVYIGESFNVIIKYTYTAFGKIASMEKCYKRSNVCDTDYFYYEQYEPKTDAHE